MRLPWALAFTVGALALAANAQGDGPPVYAYYFTGHGCHGCEQGDALMNEIAAEMPSLALTTVDTAMDYELAYALLVVAGVGPEIMPSAPGLVVGHDYVGGIAWQNGDAVRAMLAAYAPTGAPDLRPQAEAIRGQARHALPGNLRRWGVMTVVVAGLVDGINPCAFATLVFFISYLGMAGVRGRAIAGVGIAYGVGVFLVYLAFGLGILHAALALEGLPVVRRVLHGMLGAACLAFAWISVADYRHLRAGRTSEVAHQLPLGLKRLAHAAVRRGIGTRSLMVPGALLAGACVSGVELACTGQVYVPAITYMVAANADRLAAIRWLLLYDAMFMVPLLAVLLVAWLGMSSARLKGLAERQSPVAKLLLAGLFLLCALFFVLKALALL